MTSTDTDPQNYECKASKTATLCATAPCNKDYRKLFPVFVQETMRKLLSSATKWKKLHSLSSNSYISKKLSTKLNNVIYTMNLLFRQDRTSVLPKPQKH